MWGLQHGDAPQPKPTTSPSPPPGVGGGAGAGVGGRPLGTVPPHVPVWWRQGEMGLGCLRPQEPFGGRRELALLLWWVLREAARLRTAGVAGSEATHGTNGSWLSVF